MKTPKEVQEFLDELEAEFDCHTESLEWENEQLGNMDALQDILNPDQTPYTFLNLRETIMKYMGYLRAMEWFYGEGPYPPAWKFWEYEVPEGESVWLDHFPKEGPGGHFYECPVCSRWTPSPTKYCPHCGTHNGEM